MSDRWRSDVNPARHPWNASRSRPSRAQQWNVCRRHRFPKHKHTFLTNLDPCSRRRSRRSLYRPLPAIRMTASVSCQLTSAKSRMCCLHIARKDFPAVHLCGQPPQIRFSESKLFSSFLWNKQPFCLPRSLSFGDTFFFRRWAADFFTMFFSLEM